jgi:hypothetical protein
MHQVKTRHSQDLKARAFFQFYEDYTSLMRKCKEAAYFLMSEDSK